jgi:tetratricopeptide (TPR) repeat protein
MSKHATHLLAVAGLAASLLIGCGSARVEAGTGNGRDDTAGAAGEGGIPDMERVRWFVEQAGVKRVDGDVQGALDSYLEAASLCESKRIVTVECADVHYEAAGIAYERLDRELSIAGYRKAVDIYLRFGGNALAKAAVALNAVGVMYREMAEKTKARNAFEQALQVYSDTPDEFKSKANIEKIKQNIRALDEGYH